ncbi:MAG: hypothetical protein L0Y72_10040 [Gemmataceae bacterium]|nr:hypothetical protein [Gemmataceae bacterium]MCI0739373.1 hypothetical protein [Gemmataceae bacterium]
MDPKRRESILAAARNLGTDHFNHLVESVHEARGIGRLRRWQEKLLSQLSGIAPVSFAEFVEAFKDVDPIWDIPPAAREERLPTGERDHPRLGRILRFECDWVGTACLPLFAARGVAMRREDCPPPGLIRVRIQHRDGSEPSAEQEAAINRLLDHEKEVLAAVWAELAPEFNDLDLKTEVICTAVVVSRLHIDDVAYLGFSIDAETHLEHGFQVVYHPTQGTFWGDSEALNTIEEADNL